MDNKSIYEQTTAAIKELCEKAKLKQGNTVVIGCSTSEVVGSVIGTNSNFEIAGEIFKALYDYTKSKGIFIAVQCCEHLNRAIITERVYLVPGIGNVLTTAINKYDNGVIVGVALFYALLSVTSFILGDILMAAMDPRISFTSKAR